MQTGQNKTNKRLGSIDHLLNSLDGRVGNLEGRFDNLESRFDNLEVRFDNLETRFDHLEGQVKENSAYLQTVLHNQEVANAEIAGLKSTTASATGLEDIRAGLQVLNNRLFEQEKTIYKLRLVE